MTTMTTTARGQETDADLAPAVSAALSIRGLRVAYRRGGDLTPAVRGVDLDVAPGQSLAIVGESGSGKSTIARAVLGLLPASSELDGTVEVAGTDLRGLSAAAARRLRGTRIGYVPQDPGSSLDPVRRILDQVMEPLRIHGIGTRAEREARALEALAEAGLPDPERLARRFPHQLSGGQRQRVLIAAAIVARPRLIIADEPTSALDVTVQKVVLDRLQELVAASGAALLMITHDLAVAAQRTDRVLVMRAGEILERGPSREVLRSPRSDYGRELVAAIPGRRSTGAGAGTTAEPDSTADLSTTVDLDSTESSAPVLASRGVTRAFGRGAAAVTALADAELALAPGGALGIVGESGSGKTTLARILLGLERSDAGAVELDGAPIGRRDRSFRRRIQPVFQNPHTSFDPMRTVGWSILEPARTLGPRRPRTEREARLESLLADVGLDPALARRRPHELSGGQLQRAAIARALSVEPEVLVCDEAVSALDVTVQATVLDLLARLRRERGLALLLITHDLAVVEDVCDQVVVMQGGRVVEAGATAEVFARPRHACTRALIEAIPDPWS